MKGHKNLRVMCHYIFSNGSRMGSPINCTYVGEAVYNVTRTLVTSHCLGLCARAARHTSLRRLAACVRDVYDDWLIRPT